MVCPAANIPNASVLVLENGQFYVAPVVYQGVRESLSFQGHVADDIPPAPPRRVRGKTSVARGESGLGDVEHSGSGDVESQGCGFPLEGLGDAASKKKVVMRVVMNLKGWFLIQCCLMRLRTVPVQCRLTGLETVNPMSGTCGVSR